MRSAVAGTLQLGCAMPCYGLDGTRMAPGDAGWHSALEAAHAGRQRPLCLCTDDGVEMYVARLGAGFVVKRLPYSGARHAPGCPSYEPPPEWSGLGQVVGSAISEDPATGMTSLKLDFPLSKIGARTIDPGGGDGSDSVVSDGTRLTLRGLLHYLWDQAELTRWQPGFTGRRSWATVRRHLLQAAEGKLVRGLALGERLYIPELFSVEQREEIAARRLAKWGAALPPATGATGARPLMLLIGEVKEIAPARYGCKAVIKHLPDQAFGLDAALYRRLERRFAGELSLWGASDTVHLVMVATFGIHAGGLPVIDALSLMPVTAQWLPIEDRAEQQLVERLVRDGRCFVKGLRYNLPGKRLLASAVLTDVGDESVGLCIAPGGLDDDELEAAMDELAPGQGSPVWLWRPAQGPMPGIPPARRPERYSQTPA